MKPNFLARRKKLMSELEKKGIDLLLTSNPQDIFYYTGYRGLKEDKVFMLFPVDGEPKLAVSVLENEAHLRYPEIIYMKKVEDFIEPLKQCKKIGYDEKFIDAVLYQTLLNLKIKLEPVSFLLEAQRMIKDEYEIQQLRKAVEITGKVFDMVCEMLRGKSEREIANQIEIEYKKMGFESAFEPIVCAGRNTQFVHHKPNEKIVKSKDLVLIDTGCNYDGYCADVTRMFFKRLDKKQRKVYEDLKEIRDALLPLFKADVEVKEIERMHDEFFKKMGYKPIHNFGHGVGLSIHEPLGEKLKENMTLTLEPGIYIKNFMGCRIEDTILIRKNKAEVLSKRIPILE